MIYLDTCLVVYWVENHSIFAPLVRKRILEATSDQFAVSPLVMAEALVMPLRRQHTALLTKFQSFFDNVVILPMTDTVFMDAARLRAFHTGLKMPDAMHLACAKYHGCTAFWTNDQRLQRVADGYVLDICGK